MEEKTSLTFTNPYRPGAGHKPPYLAGRESEKKEFQKLLKQEIISENLILTGLRGVGKTVLLDDLKPTAIEQHWLWAGTDLSEAVSISEEAVAKRIITDLSMVTSSIVIDQQEIQQLGFAKESILISRTLNFNTLVSIYQEIPGLTSDKLKLLLEITWKTIEKENKRGVIFAYDEAQTLSDQAQKDQYPLSLLLDVFQSIQKKNIPFMLILTGLPTLFPGLVEARTFSERMFHVLFLNRLSKEHSKDAILVPLKKHDFPLDDDSVNTIVELSGGYPYFIQFICREVYDAFLQEINSGNKPSVPVQEIIQKLDTDFFSGRWDRATDRQRELLSVAASLDNCGEEFTINKLAKKSKELLEKTFSGSHVNQMLSKLCDTGLVYKNRHGKYSFAVPLLWTFIRRQELYRKITQQLSLDKE